MLLRGRGRHGRRHLRSFGCCYFIGRGGVSGRGTGGAVVLGYCGLIGDRRLHFLRCSLSYRAGAKPETAISDDHNHQSEKQQAQRGQHLAALPQLPLLRGDWNRLHCVTGSFLRHIRLAPSLRRNSCCVAIVCPENLFESRSSGTFVLSLRVARRCHKTTPCDSRFVREQPCIFACATMLANFCNRPVTLINLAHRICRTESAYCFF